MKLKSGAKYVIGITIKVIKLKTYKGVKISKQITTQNRRVTLQREKKMNFGIKMACALNPNSAS